MENNIFIIGDLKAYLDFADARAHVTIFERQGDKETIIKQGAVYEIITDADFMKKYRHYDVVGLNISLVNNILIEKPARFMDLETAINGGA